MYYAKSKNEHHGKITIKEHCEKVGDLAEKYGDEIGRPKEAKTEGVLHDFGKYGETFADVLTGKVRHVDHAFSSAAFLYVAARQICVKNRILWEKYEPAFGPIIESVMGHHDGLVSVQSLDIQERLKITYESDDADCCPSGKFPSLRGKNAFRNARNAFKADFPQFRFPALYQRRYENEVENMLNTRMLFSCLVDADYSISASDDDPDYLTKNAGTPLDAVSAMVLLEAYRRQIQEKSTADKELNRIRDKVYADCGKIGSNKPGLFSLTAPTGVGKTLAMMHFALRHCITNTMRRIIVVLPFLTLAEQTEKEYSRIFPEILVDHSQKKLPEEKRELSARWSASVIITTSVRFFESLFADKPTDCRKLHNIANSVILFDEAQSLPSDLAPVTIQAVNILCEKYRCTMVFSTATQPDYQAIEGARWHPTEIISDSKSLFEKTKRVQIEWRLNINDLHIYRSDFCAIASEMTRESSICAVVNLRRHARELFHALANLVRDSSALFLLTTDLCPAHRLEVVREIKRRQMLHEPCIVVATQCIEAGVDLDFDVLYRALAPLEAIIQAAGRCNRNRRQTFGKVVVFEPLDERRAYPGDSYERAAMIVKTLWASNPELDINDPGVIAEYYRRYFAEENGSRQLANAILEKEYADVARYYRLIQNEGVKLIVPCCANCSLFHRIRDAERITTELLRAAAPITVSCYDEEFVRTIATPIRIRLRGTEQDTGYYILNRGFENYYDSVIGLQYDECSADEYLI